MKLNKQIEMQATCLSAITENYLKGKYDEQSYIKRVNLLASNMQNFLIA